MKMNLGLVNLASSLIAHSYARHAVLSENIANADTPGYRARDLESFDATMGDAVRVKNFAARATHPDHIGFNAQNVPFEVREVAAFGAAQPNGNSVTLEDQMIRSTEVKHNHEMALGVYRKSIDILRLGLGRRN